MRIAASFCREHSIACEVSMERRMACGIGACLSCVLDTTSGKKRSCVDGPVFDANEVEW
jgi:dihydroorotate dehydrogenase electron transfer subunit